MVENIESILVTGSNRNLGLGLVQHYANAGLRVYATCRDLSKSGDLKAIQNESPGRVSIHELDVSRKESIGSLAATLAGESIDVLINNASIPGQHRLDKFGETDYSEWEMIFRINAFGPMMMAEAFTDHVASSQRKVIASISSRLGSAPTFRMAGYRASKAALNQIVMQIALGLEDRGVISVALHPGWVKNDITRDRAILTPAQSAAMLADVIAGLTMKDTGKFFDPDGSEFMLVTQQMDDKPYSMPKARPSST